jgi:hypothetical protein
LFHPTAIVLLQPYSSRLVPTSMLKMMYNICGMSTFLLFCSHTESGWWHCIAFSCPIRPRCSCPVAHQSQRQHNHQEQRRSDIKRIQLSVAALIYGFTGRLASDVATGAARGMVRKWWKGHIKNLKLLQRCFDAFCYNIGSLKYGLLCPPQILVRSSRHLVGKFIGLEDSG